MTLLRATGVDIEHGRAAVLRDVDFEISAGEIVTVIGPNGSGKSSLVRALIGTLPIARGRIERKPGLRIGYVPQKLAIDETLPMTVERFLNLPFVAAPEAVTAGLERAGIGELRRRQVVNLSGGQFQRVLLARAILTRPDILILDEPTQGLDHPGVAEFYQLLAGLRDELGCAILMVSHDLHVVMSATERVICLNGHICCEGTPQVVLAAPEYRALFGAGTAGSLALYRHEHDHSHSHSHHSHNHEHPGGAGHDD